MSAIKDLFYDIETMFIEGHSAKSIAAQLDCPIEQVLAVLESFGVNGADVAETPQADEVYSPYFG